MKMTVRCEWMGADYTAVRPLIRGDFASDNQEVDESDLAVEVAVDEGVVFTGSREQLINLGSRIIEAAITAHARAEREPAKTFQLDHTQAMINLRDIRDGKAHASVVLEESIENAEAWAESTE